MKITYSLPRYKTSDFMELFENKQFSPHLDGVVESAIMNQAFLLEESHLENFYLNNSPANKNELKTTQKRKRKKNKRKLPTLFGMEHNKLGYNKQMEVKFTEMLHNHVFFEKIPSKHILQLVKPGDVTILMEDILKTPVSIILPNLTLCMFQESKLNFILKKMVKHWTKFKIRYFLEKECPVQTLSSKSKSFDQFTADKCTFSSKFLKESVSAACALPTNNSESNRNSELNPIKTEFVNCTKLAEDSHLNKALEWKMVYRFLQAILRYVIPLDLFGSGYNRNCFQKTVKALLMTGKNDIITLEQVMFEVKISHCKWAAHLNSFALRTKIVAKVWLWLLRNLIIRVLKSFFYITESVRSFQLLFFRKKDFQRLHDSGIKSLLKDGQFCKVVPQLVANWQRNLPNNRLPESKPASLRFIPKAKGLRPIHSVKRGGLSFAESLRAKVFIDYVINNFFQDVSSVSLASFQSLWIRFWESLGNNDVPLFVVKVDVEDAFGSIKLDVLLSLLSKAQGSLPDVVRVAHAESEKPSTKFRSYFAPPPSKAELHLNVCEAVENIKKVVLWQIAKAGTSRRLLKVRGIAQGGSLSSSLCELYYAALHKKYLVRFCGKVCLLTRCVDDFFYVTPDREQAHQFLAFMERGIEEFGCYINTQKTVHNLDGNHKRILFRGVLLCTLSKQFLIPVSSLSLYPPRYSLRLKATKPGQFILMKLQQIVKARLPSLVFHPAYTSTPALVSNIWRAGITAGARLVCLIRTLLLPQKRYNPKFLSKIVIKTAVHVWSKVNGLWTRLEHPLPFCKSFCFVVFIGGMLMMMGLPKHLPLTSLRRILKGVIRLHRRLITLEEKQLLPRPSRKFFDVFSIPICKKAAEGNVDADD